MEIVGLGLILVSWLYQLYYILKGSPAVKPFFLLVYAIGVLFLVYESWRNGAMAIALFNLSLVIPVAIIFWKTYKMK